MIWLALLGYAAALLGAVHLEQRTAHLLTSPPLAWLGERVYFPLARFAALVAFVLLAYPALLARPDLDLPPLGALLAAQAHAGAELQGVALLTTLLLPLVPALRQRSNLVLAAQSLALTALLGTWTARAIGSEPFSLLPSVGVVALLALLLAVGEAVAAVVNDLAVLHLEDRAARQRIVQLAALAIQAPVALVYGRALGAALG